MLKYPVTYTDYDGIERTETLYFNLTKTEIMEWNILEDGGLEALINKVIAEKDQKKMLNLWKTLIRKSYGVKSSDGKRMIKNDEVWDAFAQSEAYSVLFIELASNDEKAAEFVKGIIPSK